MVAATDRDVGASTGFEFPGIPSEFRGFPKIPSDALDFPRIPWDCFGFAGTSLVSLQFLNSLIRLPGIPLDPRRYQRISKDSLTRIP